MPRALKPEFQACKHIDALLGGSEITLRKLVNFPHQTLVPDEKVGFRRDSGVHAVVGPANSGH